MFRLLVPTTMRTFLRGACALDDAGATIEAMPRDSVARTCQGSFMVRLPFQRRGGGGVDAIEVPTRSGCRFQALPIEYFAQAMRRGSPAREIGAGRAEARRSDPRSRVPPRGSST